MIPRAVLRWLKPGESVLFPIPADIGPERRKQQARINQAAWYLWGPGRYHMRTEARRWARVRRV